MNKKHLANNIERYEFKIQNRFPNVVSVDAKNEK